MAKPLQQLAAAAIPINPENRRLAGKAQKLAKLLPAPRLPAPVFTVKIR